jgi:hypothetical protein
MSEGSSNDETPGFDPHNQIRTRALAHQGKLVDDLRDSFGGTKHRIDVSKQNPRLGKIWNHPDM